MAACHKRDTPPKPYVAFVANSQSNSVAAVDLGNLRMATLIPVASGPSEIAARPQSHEVWVVSTSGTISVIRFPELDVAATLRIGSSAQSLVFSRDGRRAFALDPDQSQVVFLDSEVRRVAARVRVGTPPKNVGAAAEPVSGALPTAQAASTPARGHLALTPNGQILVVSASADPRLYFVSPDSERVLGSVEVGKEPGPMVILPDSSKVFVADTGEEKVSAVDIASRQLLSHLELAARPSALLLKPDGGEIFVLSYEGASLTILDAFHDNVEQNLTTGRQPVAAVIRRDQTVLYIANAGDGSVTALDVENRSVLSSTHAGAEPRALALTPDERFLVAADAASSDVAILRTDLADNPASGPTRTERTALVTTIPVGARPLDVVIPDWLSRE